MAAPMFSGEIDELSLEENGECFVTTGNKATKYSKSERKILKKLSKIKQILQKEDGIIPSAKETPNIVVGNGGLGNNIQRSELFQIFSTYGIISDIITLPDKSFSFVCFKKKEDASKAHSKVQGRELKCPEEISIPGIRFYLYFTDKVIRSSIPEFKLPEGLTIVPDFITPQDEADLLHSISWEENSYSESACKGMMKHRQVKHFGYEFRYDNNNVDKDKPLDCPIPALCNPIIDQMLKQKYIKYRPDQLTVNQYQPGQGIPPHVDTHSAFEDGIISLSLGSPVVMEFRHPDGRHVPVVLPARSLLVMSAASRFQWSHGITPRKSDVLPDQSQDDDQQRLTLSKRSTRTSFTFRKVRQEKCSCDFPQQCDDQEEKQTGENKLHPLSTEEAVALESKHVHQVYEVIAQDFSGTRHSPWPQVVDFLKQLPESALVADIGCGNGKYLAVQDTHYKIGCDRSRNLCEICGQRGLHVFSCDALAVPLRSGVFDAALSIAVIHHLSTKERRLQAIEELLRILAPGGQALIYVWALEQEYKKVKSNYLKDSKIPQANSGHTSNKCQDSCTENKSGSNSSSKTCQTSSNETESETVTAAGLNVHVNRTQFKDNDVLVPWHLKKTKNKAGNDESKEKTEEPNNIYHRFYHVFQENELETLCSELPGLKIIKSYYDKGNWCVIFTKT